MKPDTYSQRSAGGDVSDILETLQGYLLAAGGVTLFSAKGIVIRFAYEMGAQPSPIELLALRMGIAVPIYITVGIWLLRQRRLEGAPRLQLSQIGPVVLVGTVGYHLASYLDFVGLVFITAQLEQLILFTYPLLVLLLSAVFLGGRLTIGALGAFALSYSGLVLVFFTGSTPPTVNTLVGGILVAGAALSLAIYQLASRPLMEGLGSKLYTCVAIGGAATSVLLHASIDSILSPEPWLVQIPSSLLPIGALLAVVCTVLPSFMMSAAVAQVGPEAVAIMGILSPIFTVLLAVIVLGEPLGVMDATGTVLVMAGVGLYSWLDRSMRVDSR